MHYKATSHLLIRMVRPPHEMYRRVLPPRPVPHRAQSLRPVRKLLTCQEALVPLPSMHAAEHEAVPG